ncbi:MAG TPA: glycosyltransferase family 2 protein [Acidimicrobiales bacterium]|nr:glycosyltransferase family 2 protein [Acidimicrobiales bacterium]
MTTLLNDVAGSPVLSVALAFLALYPIAMAVVWVVTSVMYAFRREVGDDGSFAAIPDDRLLSVSIIVPAYEEELVLDATLEALHDLDYPDYEVLVVDDASRDRTSDIARAHVARDPRFRLLRKEINEGKAMAMNDAMPLTSGEVIVIVDADARLHRGALRPIVAHFVRLPRVGAVTGNPRVVNRLNLLTELQTLEFTSIVSILRRAQVVWGRILTVSGVISAFRRSALEDVGLFDPSMATEDIDVSWRLQRRFYDIRYEPRALIDMAVPTTWKGLWRQRRRWSTGLVQVLRRHRGVVAHWRNRRHWPVFIETCLSVLWAHTFVVLLGVLGPVPGKRPSRPGGLPIPQRLGHVDLDPVPRTAGDGRLARSPVRPLRGQGTAGGAPLPVGLLAVLLGRHRSLHHPGAVPPQAQRGVAVAHSARAGTDDVAGAAISGLTGPFVPGQHYGFRRNP